MDKLYEYLIKQLENGLKDVNESLDMIQGCKHSTLMLLTLLDDLLDLAKQEKLTF